MEQFLAYLKKSDLDLVREIEPDRMAELDEDELIDLHRRVRRRRNKHLKNYRRGGAQRVQEKKARGAAWPKGGKPRMRAAAFEEALSQVSARLAEVAHQAAEDLKEERLERARAGKSSGPDLSAEGTAGVGKGRARVHKKSTGGLKRDASTRSKGRRRQAKRDSR